MATSSSIESPAPLKGKLTQVKYLLDDANKRLQEEVSKYEIFTTKTSASATAGATTNIHNDSSGNPDRYAPSDLIRTISDIGTLRTVLSCPIFKRIVNVTDSLDKLSYHLNLHPSIGPSDISIDAEGELILAPPIEPTALNNLINSKLDGYNSDQSNNSPQIVSPKLVVNNGDNNTNNGNDRNISPDNIHRQQNRNQMRPFNGSQSEVGSSNGFVQQQLQNQGLATTNLKNQQQFCSQKYVSAVQSSYVPSQNNVVSQSKSYDTEKLVSNGANKTYMSSNKTTTTSQPPLARHQQETNIETDHEGNRLYKSNGHFILDQVPDNADVSSDFQSTRSVGRVCDQTRSRGNGCTNEMYKTTHELNHFKSVAIEPQQLIRQNQDPYMKHVQSHNSTGNGKDVQNPSVQYNRGSCSPSTSAGSTVRLADDCDSGASSYQSHIIKGATYSPHAYKSNDQMNEAHTVVASSNEERVGTTGEELIDNLTPDIEKIKVTLERDEKNEFGIIVAGYSTDNGEISGIFIKKIHPNSPAERSGKIQTLDQVYSVNGRVVLDYPNSEAINEIRRTGKVVTLELMRYLAEAKYMKLKTALERVDESPRSSPYTENLPTHDHSVKNSTGAITSSSKSSIPVSKLRDASQSPTKTTLVQVSNNQQQQQAAQSIYKNEYTLNKTNITTSTKTSIPKQFSFQSSKVQDSLESQSPVAAQRGGTNKVIETKQGARNTVDIRSPACQTTATATFVNKAAEMEYNSTANKMSITSRLQSEVAYEFGKFTKQTEEPEWEKDAQIIELYKDYASQGLGFSVKEYADPKDQKRSILMITSITPGGIAELDGRLSFGDLLIFVDDTSLEGASLTETVKAITKTNGQVRLGVLKLKRT